MEGNAVRFEKIFGINNLGSLELGNIIVGARRVRDITIERANNHGCIAVDCSLVTKIEMNVSTTKASPSDNLAYSYLFPNPGSSQLELLNYNLVESGLPLHSGHKERFLCSQIY